MKTADSAFSFRFYLSAKWVRMINIATGCVHSVYKHLLDKRIRFFRENCQRFDYSACAALLTYLKNEKSYHDNDLDV